MWHGALLVPGEDELHLGLDGLEGIENRERRPARVSEDILDPEFVEGLDQGLRAIDCFLAHRF